MKSRTHVSMGYSNSDLTRFNGRVGGGSSDLYRSDEANVSVSFAPLLSVPTLIAADGKADNFRRTDVELGAYEIKVLGLGVGAAASFTTDNTLEFDFDASLIFGVENQLAQRASLRKCKGLYPPPDGQGG
ncbi:hypothetical protein [Martelella limonii]|uniref:hypothetical protein n=1 Tax=Martelella limonii TaxID=1647649 RepID=UPI0015812CC4|nr:hypothetical protein [Martelella limonii]